VLIPDKGIIKIGEQKNQKTAVKAGTPPLNYPPMNSSGFEVETKGLIP